MAKKKKAVRHKGSRHESFKITPPKPTYEKIFFYMLGAAVVGFAVGLYFGDQVMVALASYTPAS